MSPIDVGIPSKWVCSYCENSWPTFVQVKTHMLMCRARIKLNEKYEKSGEALPTGDVI